MCVQRVSLVCGGQFGTYFATLRADCVPNVHLGHLFQGFGNV
jgi:hypothetical protein